MSLSLRHAIALSLSWFASPAAADDADGPSRAHDAETVAFVVPDLTVLTTDPVLGVASSGFGWRDDAIRHDTRFHRGADYRAPRGTAVYAAATGTVVQCQRHRGYGRMIDIDHGDGVLTRYGHLQTIGVKLGQRVESGQWIGAVGSSGRATGPHLHFEVRLDGRAVSPEVAIRIGQLAAREPPDVVWAAAQALLPETQNHSISPLDPPRHRRHRRPRNT